MKRKKPSTLLDRLWQGLLLLLSSLAALTLALVLIFILKEALPLFREVPLRDFLFGTRWMPMAYSGEPAYGILPFILASLLVAFLAVLFALFWSLGAALFLTVSAGERARALIYPLIDLLAAVPSVIYGFLGMVWLLPLMKRFYSGSGHSVLAASLLLSVMLLPFLISTISDSLIKLKERYLAPAEALGISRWHAVRTVLLPAAAKNIVLALILAIGRAMGETMAVMMVIGNAKILPGLFGKGETIAALIALEMGTAEVGSLHYRALYAAGLVLLVCLLFINAAMMSLRRRLLKGEGRAREED